MDVMALRSIFTVACLGVFVGIVLWAYSRGNKAQFDEAAKLPLAED